MLAKIRKANNSAPTKLEESIAQAIWDIQNNASVDWKHELKDLYISSVRELELEKRKVLVVFVPYRLHKDFKRIQARLIRELEKKLSTKKVVIVANRRILPPHSRLNRTATQKRPNSRTLTAVHDAILDDILYPIEVSGKRIRIKTDGSRQFKVILDSKDKSNVEDRIDAIAGVYKKLTGRDVTFIFPAAQASR